MWFFISFLVSLFGLLLLFIPLPVPLWVPMGLGATGWLGTYLVTPKTPTDFRFRRINRNLAITVTALAILWLLAFLIPLYLL